MMFVDITDIYFWFVSDTFTPFPDCKRNDRNDIFKIGATLSDDADAVLFCKELNQANQLNQKISSGAFIPPFSDLVLFHLADKKLLPQWAEKFRQVIAQLSDSTFDFFIRRAFYHKDYPMVVLVSILHFTESVRFKPSLIQILKAFIGEQLKLSDYLTHEALVVTMVGICMPPGEVQALNSAEIGLLMVIAARCKMFNLVNVCAAITGINGPSREFILLAMHCLIYAMMCPIKAPGDDAAYQSLKALIHLQPEELIIAKALKIAVASRSIENIMELLTIPGVLTEKTIEMATCALTKLPYDEKLVDFLLGMTGAVIPSYGNVSSVLRLILHRGEVGEGYNKPDIRLLQAFVAMRGDNKLHAPDIDRVLDYALKITNRSLIKAAIAAGPGPESLCEGLFYAIRADDLELVRETLSVIMRGDAEDVQSTMRHIMVCLSFDSDLYNNPNIFTIVVELLARVQNEEIAEYVRPQEAIIALLFKKALKKDPTTKDTWFHRVVQELDVFSKLVSFKLSGAECYSAMFANPNRAKQSPIHLLHQTLTGTGNNEVDLERNPSQLLYEIFSRTRDPQVKNFVKLLLNHIIEQLNHPEANMALLMIMHVENASESARNLPMFELRARSRSDGSIFIAETTTIALALLYVEPELLCKKKINPRNIVDFMMTYRQEMIAVSDFAKMKERIPKSMREDPRLFNYDPRGAIVYLQIRGRSDLLASLKRRAGLLNTPQKKQCAFLAVALSDADFSLEDLLEISRIIDMEPSLLFLTATIWGKMDFLRHIIHTHHLEGQLPTLITNNDFAVLKAAIQHDRCELLRCYQGLVPTQFKKMLKKYGTAVLKDAFEDQRFPMAGCLLSLPDIGMCMTATQSSIYLHKIQTIMLPMLRVQQMAFQQDTPRKVFDVSDEEATLLVYLLNHLGGCRETIFPDDILFCLQIPAVSTILLANPQAPENLLEWARVNQHPGVVKHLKYMIANHGAMIFQNPMYEEDLAFAVGFDAAVWTIERPLEQGASSQPNREIGALRGLSLFAAENGQKAGAAGLTRNPVGEISGDLFPEEDSSSLF